MKKNIYPKITHALLSTLFFATVSISSPSFAKAAFTITAEGEQPTYVIPGKPQSAFYRITNNTRNTLSNNYVKSFPSNTTQDTSSPDYCGTRFTLQSLESCLLALRVADKVDAANPDPDKHLFICAEDGWTCAGTTQPLNVAASPFGKIVIVVFENADEEVVLQQPTFNALSNSGAYFSNFRALTRPSQPNYIAMIAGDYFGINNNNPISLDNTSIVDLLENNNFSWKAYAEDYPGDCYLGDKVDKYVRKHNPFISFSNITGNEERCAKIVNASAFQEDVNAQNLPDFSFYIPNLINNGHDLGPSAADTWIQNFLFPIMETQYVKDTKTLFILTFDESNPKGTPEDVAENKVYTLYYGNMVKTMKTNQYNDFYNMVRTIEDAWHLGTLCRYDDSATSVNGTIWKEGPMARFEENCPAN